MPISKQEITKRILETDDEEILKAIKIIDAKIENEYIPGGTIYIPFFNQRINLRIKTIYREKGWKVEFHFDQRDGDSISLS